MTMLVYSTLLTLGLLLSAPWWLTRMATTGRYREGLWQRLGFVRRGLTDGLHGYGFNTRVVWLHAVSVGEVLAASQLVIELEAALGEGWGVVISTTTRTGYALARERFGAERVFYMPLDFAFAVRPHLEALKPAALILMESELWPRLLHECATRNIPVAVVNARISDRSYRRAQRVRALWSRVLRKPTLWLAQSEEDARRLHSLIATTPANSTEAQSPMSVISTEAQPPTTVISTGAQRSGEIPAFTTARSGTNPSILTTGNLKYDIQPAERPMTSMLRPLMKRRKLIVAGSLLDSEESRLLKCWWHIYRAEPRSALLLAPRHPERFKAVEQLLRKEHGARIYLASVLLAQSQTEQALTRLKPPTIILLDTIGDLASVYSIATIAFVGGSLVPRGGHNPLEPAQYGVPVVMGPSYENFRDVVWRMKEANGISIIGEAAGLSAAAAKNAASGRDDRSQVDALGSELVRLLTDRDAAKAMGERGRAVFESQQGATARTVTAILAMIQGAHP